MGRGLFAGLGLARGLLFLAVAMCVFVATGCIVPTPLEQAPQEPNYRPVIIPETAMPPFGPPLSLLQTSTVQIMLQADDANRDDTLLLRLAKLGSMGPLSRAYLPGEVKMQYPGVPDPDHPLRRSGGFQDLNLCGLFGAGTTTLFAVVADRSFADSPDQMVHVQGGLYDEKSWELDCQ